MTRKDYKVLAEGMKKLFEEYGPEDNIPSEAVLKNLMRTLKADNSRFDAEKFAEACLPNSKEIGCENCENCKCK